MGSKLRVAALWWTLLKRNYLCIWSIEPRRGVPGVWSGQDGNGRVRP